MSLIYPMHAWGMDNEAVHFLSLSTAVSFKCNVDLFLFWVLQ